MDRTLAIHGGSPVRKPMLPYGRQSIDEQDIAEVVKVLKSDYLTQGPVIGDFEKAVAQRANARYAVAFCNGTAALHGACYAAGIGLGDEVITTSMTFAASSNCVLYQGGTPVFADIDPDTYLIDLDKAEALITSRTKAIIPVDYTGMPVNMRAVKALADKHGLLVIQDAAHSFGASYDGESVGSVADMTMFSFHPVKPVTTGEGGVIVTNDNELYRKLLLFRSHGITRDANQLEDSSHGPWYYEMQELGYNYRMTELQAALGLSQLSKLDSFIARRQEIAGQYHEAFEALEMEGLLKRPNMNPEASSGWHLYVVQFIASAMQGRRDDMFQALREEGIGVNLHYIPVHLHPYYRRLGYEKRLCPHAEDMYENMVTLPLFPQMTNADVQDVIEAVQKVALTFSNK